MSMNICDYRRRKIDAYMSLLRGRSRCFLESYQSTFTGAIDDLTDIDLMIWRGHTYGQLDQLAQIWVVFNHTA
jgi:hypothetical protein